MPRGFPDIPSGVDLPPRLWAIREAFLRGLVIGREKGRITPERRMTGKQIAREWGDRHIKAKKNGKPALRNDVDVRALVNYWRRQGKPIAAPDNRGYFYALTYGELVSTIESLYDRRKAIDTAIKGLEKAFKQGDMFG